MLVPKNQMNIIFGRKKFGLKNLGSKKIFGLKQILGPKIFCFKNIFGPKKGWV